MTTFVSPTDLSNVQPSPSENLNIHIPNNPLHFQRIPTGPVNAQLSPTDLLYARLNPLYNRTSLLDSSTTNPLYNRPSPSNLLDSSITNPL